LFSEFEFVVVGKIDFIHEFAEKIDLGVGPLEEFHQVRMNSKNGP
jgi:hypothetical protein